MINFNFVCSYAMIKQGELWCATVMLPLPLVVLLFMRAFAESLIHINILVTGVNHVFVMVSLHLETPSKKVINL